MQMDMNVSLTAIGLLWNASDLISKLHSKSTTEAGNDSKAVAAQTFKIDAVQFEELIRQLFGALQVPVIAIEPIEINGLMDCLHMFAFVCVHMQFCGSLISLALGWSYQLAANDKAAAFH